jgi:hypothetical protein
MNRIHITVAAGVLLLATAQHSFAGSRGVGIGQSASQSIASIRTRGNTTTITGGTEHYQAPAVFAPGLAAASIETCLGSVSIGASGPGGGLSFGTTTEDKPCQARLDARTLWAFGMKAAAIRRLCINPQMAESLGEGICPQIVQTQQPTIFSMFQHQGR